MNTDRVLNSEKVNEIFMDCLFKDNEDTSKYIEAAGIFTKVGFHPERLESHKKEIEVMLNELPDEFKEGSGDGMSFLNACIDKHGNQWTNLHQRMEQLFQLGIGIGKVKNLVPREMWKILPGGMPYYVVTN